MKKLAKEIGVDVHVLRSHLHKYAARVAACETVAEKKKYNKAYKAWITHIRMGGDMYFFSPLFYSDESTRRRLTANEVAERGIVQ